MLERQVLKWILFFIAEIADAEVGTVPNLPCLV